MASNEGLPAYLTNLNSNLYDDLLHGKEYLQGLPLRHRSSKRKRADDDIVGYQQQTSSLWYRFTRKNPFSQFRFDDVQFKDGAIILLVAIIATTVIIVSVQRGSISKLRCFNGGTSDTISNQHTRRKKKRKKRKKKTTTNPINHLADCKPTMSPANDAELDKKQKVRIKETNIEQPDDRKQTEIAIVTPSKHKEEITKCEPIEANTSPTHGQQTINTFKETLRSTPCSSNKNASIIIHENPMQLNSQAKFPINEIASRWESLGLSKQKSLELAANAELNWYFYQDLKQFLSSAVIHLYDQLSWHSIKLFTQSESHHRERMNAPAMDMLRRRREEVKFSLLSTQLLSRCLFLALAARFVRRDNLASLSSTAFGTFLSNLCPDWNMAISRDTMSNFVYYDLDSWRNAAYSLMESISSAWYCVCRMVFCTACLGLLHCVSKKLTYALIASTMVPWREILSTGIVLVVTNGLLTFSLLKRCSNFDLGSEKTGGDALKIDARQTADLYNRQMNNYRILSYFISVCIGLLEIDASFWISNEHLI